MEKCKYSCEIRTQFARTSRENRQCAYSNAKHTVANFAGISREYGVENNAYLTCRRAGHSPRPLLGLLRPLRLWHSVQQPPGGGRAPGGQRSPKCPCHLRVPVRRVRLHHLHLIRPVPHEISPSRTVTGEMPCAERERNRGWCVHTEGLDCTSGGLKTSSTTSLLDSSTRASNPTPNSNSCPNVGTSSPTPHSSRPR